MRIAVLGAGRMGVKHTRAYQGIEGVDVAGIVGRTPEKVETVSADLGIPGWTDPGRILEDRTIDSIDISVPSDQHRVFAEAALSHDKHVFCETPMTLTLEDADAIVAAARSSQKIFGVALLMRFVADMDYVSERLTSGLAGAPIAAIGCRLSPPYSSGGKDEHYGDPIIELMLFELDILVRLFGMPSSVTASSASPDSLGHILATFRWDGFHVQLEATNQMAESHPFKTYFGLRKRDDRVGVHRQERAVRGRPVPVSIGRRTGTDRDWARSLSEGVRVFRPVCAGRDGSDFYQCRRGETVDRFDVRCERVIGERRPIRRHRLKPGMTSGLQVSAR